MADVPTIILSALFGASAGGSVTWLLSPRIAARQARAVMEVQRPKLKGEFLGWGLIGPTVRVFNVGGRKTTITEVGIYGEDGVTKSESVWTIYEGGIDERAHEDEGVDAFNPPRGAYLPKVLEAGDCMDIPISTNDLASTVYGRYGRPRLGLSDFWVEEADRTLTRVVVEQELRDGLLAWMPEPPPEGADQPPPVPV